MTKDELRIKIAAILQSRAFENRPYTNVEIGYITALDIADALIAAGLKFDTVVSHTATFDLMQQEQINRLEIRVAEAEHRAEVAERALELMARGECTFASPEYYKKQAEKELAEEKDD